jgi:hypothetical protein
MVVLVSTVVIVLSCVNGSQASINPEDPLKHPDCVLSLEEASLHIIDLVVLHFSLRHPDSFQQLGQMLLIGGMLILQLEDAVVGDGLEV